VGWLVGSWPLFWALFISFILGTAYSINVLFLTKPPCKKQIKVNLHMMLDSIFIYPFSNLHISTSETFNTRIVEKQGVTRLCNQHNKILLAFIKD
jgi:hypothetical protein